MALGARLPVKKMIDDIDVELPTKAATLEPSSSTPRFCAYCGSAVDRIAAAAEGSRPSKCGSCGRVTHIAPEAPGPAILVLTIAYAENRVLLMKRGLPPYRECWAPPGGFVEHRESLEAAAVREVQEEVGIEISPRSLLPHGIISLPSLNQVHVVFLALIEKAIELKPQLPEALDARWFSEVDYMENEVWAPSKELDIGRVFERVRSGELHFYQQSEDWGRVISDTDEVTYLWQR
jgi:ADP-ribose pyrophosphatase YjhB (NUDIX family)